MRIAVFGGNGKVGRLVVAEALRRGHSVTILVHRSKPPEQSKLTIIPGDIHNPEDVAIALVGADAVISTLGSWGTESKDIMSAAMSNIVPAMKARGLDRIITVTGNVARMPDEHQPLHIRLLRAVLGTCAPKVLEDSEQHLKILAGSTLNWTSVRASAMTSRNKRGYTLVERPPLLQIIPKLAVACSLVDLAENSEWSGQAPGIKAG